MHLLQDLVDVDLVRLSLGLLLAALAALGDGLLGGLLGGGGLGHGESWCVLESDDLRARSGVLHDSRKNRQISAEI